LDEEITLIEIEIEKRNEILKSRISSYQENGGNIQYLEVFLGSKDFTEFISRLSAVTTITNADADLIALQKNDKGLVEGKLVKQEELLSELKEMETLILEQKETVEAGQQDLQQQDGARKDKQYKAPCEDGKLARLEQEIKAEMTEIVEPPGVVHSNNQTNDSMNNSHENSIKPPHNSPEV